MVADLNAGLGSGAPSTGRLLSVNFIGFSLYSGNLPKVHENPDLAGLQGLNGTSIRGLISFLTVFSGMGGSSCKIYFSVLNPPQVFTL